MAFLNFDWQVSNRVRLYLEGLFSQATFNFDPFELPPVDTIPPESPLSPQNDHPISDYDYSQISQYSDLDYSQVNATVGFNWLAAKNRSVYGTVTMFDLTDDQPYVYGDMTGKLMQYAAGMTVNF